jgi:hypothetical protein
MCEAGLASEGRFSTEQDGSNNQLLHPLFAFYLLKTAFAGPPLLGEQRPWVLKDLRKMCATYYDEHVPESSVEIVGHSAGGITYRHYAHPAPLAFRAILSLPQPSAFKSLARGFEDQCPCRRRRFVGMAP